jgi:hypothetical protein
MRGLLEDIIEERQMNLFLYIFIQFGLPLIIFCLILIYGIKKV